MREGKKEGKKGRKEGGKKTAARNPVDARRGKPLVKSSRAPLARSSVIEAPCKQLSSGLDTSRSHGTLFFSLSLSPFHPPLG